MYLILTILQVTGKLYQITFKYAKLYKYYMTFDATNHNQNSILKTLIYFDIFNTPLTREEIWRWLWEENNPDYFSLIKNLDLLVQNKTIQSKNGYYFLTGKKNNIDLRQSAVPLVEEKMKIAVKATKKIRYIPFVEAVFACNTVAGAGVKKESDIDVFIIIKKDRIWISRLLTTLVLGFFRLRRNKNHIANKICLSFYVTTDALDLSKIKIEGTDIYLVYWLDNLIPIYDPKNMSSELRQVNSWLNKYIPNAKTVYDTLDRWKVDDTGFTKLIKSFLEIAWQGKYGDMIEAQAKGIQKTKMKMNYMSNQDKADTGVIISDSMLKFHENDRREMYRKKWEDNYKQL